MSETVFILGAGASKAAGAPLMQDFLDAAEKLMKQGKLNDIKADYDLVFKGIEALHMALPKARYDVSNIESVAGAFEMAHLFKNLGALQKQDVEMLPEAMKRLIVCVIERSITLRVAGPTEGKRVLPPQPYDKFVEYLVKVIKDGISYDFEKVSVLTFNYDLSMDYAFHYAGIPINYCLDDTMSDSGMKLLKLHGSFNWGHCSVCKKVIPWRMKEYFEKYNWQHLWNNEFKTADLHLTNHLKEHAHCGKKGMSPVIVPPTWNKTQYHQTIDFVWQAAVTELKNAENIYVCGYSYPETDQFFKTLYALGTTSPTRLKRFWVFNPDETRKDKFRNMLGQAAEDRFSFYAKTFAETIPELPKAG